MLMEPLYSNANDRSTESELDDVRKSVKRGKELMETKKKGVPTGC